MLGGGTETDSVCGGGERVTVCVRGGQCVCWGEEYNTVCVGGVTVTVCMTVCLSLCL